MNCYKITYLFETTLDGSYSILLVFAPHHDLAKHLATKALLEKYPKEIPVFAKMELMGKSEKEHEIIFLDLKGL